MIEANLPVAQRPPIELAGSPSRRARRLLAAVVAALSGVATGDTVYVTLEKDNGLAVLDGVTGQLTSSAKVGKRPRGVLLSKDARQLFVAVSDEDVIRVVDTGTLKSVRDLPSGEDPETFAMDPEGSLLFVSNEDDNLVSVIDIARGKRIKQIPVGVEPEGIAVSPDGRWVVSTSETTNMVHWIDRKRLEVIDNTLVDPRPRAAAFTADSRQLWVTSEIAGSLSVLDAESRQLLKRITFKIPGVTAEKVQPVGICIDSGRRFGYVALGPANRVAVVDAQTLEVKDYLLVGQRVWNLAFSADQSRLFTTNGVSNDVSVIDLAGPKVLKSVAVGLAPWGVAVRP